mgnify:FL=1
MTGYGLSSSIKGNSEVSVEIKGVNHRFLEISLKSNEISNDIDQYIRNIVGKNIIRGKVDIKIKFKSPSESKYFIDTKLLKNLKKSIKDNLGIEEHLKFSDIKDIPGILNIESKKSINNTFLKREFNKALKDFTDSRNKEGMKIKKVIDKKIQGIDYLVSKILKQSKKDIHRRHRLYKEKVASLVSDLDEARLEQEIALLALKHDASEELDRISFHSKSLKLSLIHI